MHCTAKFKTFIILSKRTCVLKQDECVIALFAGQHSVVLWIERLRVLDDYWRPVLHGVNT